MRHIFRAAVAFLACPLAFAAGVSEPVGAVQAFFDAMSARNVTAIHGLFSPDATLTAIRSDGIVSTSRSDNFEQRLSSTSKELWLERIWEPKVMEHGAMAVVWAPYDFYLGGKFSHCGIDNFNLVKTEGKWRIAGVIFTVEKEGCAASPLGPPALH